MESAKKVDRFTIKRHTNQSGNISFRVSGYKPDGTRVRKNFALKSEAIEYRGSLDSEIEEGELDYSLERTTLTRAELQDAENAYQLAGDRNLSSIVSEYLSLQRSVNEKAEISLSAAVAFFSTHYRPEIREVTIYNGTQKFLDTRSGLEASTVRGYKQSVNLLVGKEPNKMVHNFTVQDIESILSKYKSPGSKRAHRSVFSVFFNWAKRFHYCLENPCERLDRLPPVVGDIGILRLEESKRLLKAAVLLHDGVMAPAIAIALFAGLRPSELEELKPEDIKSKNIRVSGGKLRRKLKRSVPIPEVLRSWLKEYPYTGHPSGWTYKMRKLKTLTKAKKWVDDILRHTSISYQLERDRNEGGTAFNNGTSSQMINQHYRDVVDDEEEVANYWKLTPEVIKNLVFEDDLNQRDFPEWPTDEELKKMVWDKPLSRLSKDLNVSDNAIRKRCKKHNIELPRNGHWQKMRAQGKACEVVAWP
jgi:integrase